jgi:hypothetical protein
MSHTFPGRGGGTYVKPVGNVAPMGSVVKALPESFKVLRVRNPCVNHMCKQLQGAGEPESRQNSGKRHASTGSVGIPLRENARGETHDKVLGNVTSSAMVVIALSERSKVLRFRVLEHSTTRTRNHVQ